MIRQYFFYFVTFVKPVLWFCILFQRSTAQEFAQLYDVSHCQGKMPIPGSINSVGSSNIGMTIVHRTSYRQFMAIIIKTGQHFKLEIQNTFKHTYLNQGTFARKGTLVEN